jgi:hypothetical protein
MIYYRKQEPRADLTLSLFKNTCNTCFSPDYQKEFLIKKKGNGVRPLSFTF